MIRRYNTPEILAPCGSYDILTAAVKAGADACYIGGSRFGARAYADNLDSDSIVKAIDYAHLHGVKLYLTVNTLFKNNEIDELIDYLIPYYEAGLDAVIVQDLGAFSVIRRSFPDLNIHCSTQMNITSRHGARLMKEKGASRIVAAREMTLDEIKRVKAETDIELEVFVHGAMCYSYSGQCLLSSAAGERSGNRGRCAQPCRKCYDGLYILSMKDMCSLFHIPDLIGAGVDSLKIEGRMKNAYYVASAVSAYRELRDSYMEGNFDKKRAYKLKEKLAAIYNRGGFTDGYFYFDKASESDMDMISKSRPNNQGTLVGKAVGVSSGRVKLKLSDSVYEGDVLELELKNNESLDITLASGGKGGQSIYAPSPKTRMLDIPFDVYRTRCKKLIDEIDEGILSGDNYGKLHIDGVFTAKTGEPMRLKLSLLSGKNEYQAEVCGDTVAPAKNSFANESDIKSKLLKLGATDYIMDNLSLDISGDAFVPSGEIKSLRRRAVSMLEDKLTSSYRRKYRELDGEGYNPVMSAAVKSNALRGGQIVHVRISTIRQLKETLRFPFVYAVYMDKDIYKEAVRLGLTDKIKQCNIKIYINMPYVVKNRFEIDNYLPKGEINGIYIRNIDTFAAAVDKGLFSSYELVCAASLYGYNNEARSFLIKEGGADLFEMPYELTLKELSGLEASRNIFNVYGYRQVMVSAQCVLRNKSGCRHDNGITVITDDKDNRFYCRCVCGECCNVIYNGVPFSMLDRLGNLGDVGYNYLSVDFAAWEDDKAADILSSLEICLNGDTNLKQMSDKVFTTGHCYKGVE